MKVISKACLIALFLFISTVSFGQDKLPPCKLKYDNGRCKERYNEDSNGEPHGKYIRYNELGSVIMLGNYLHGLQQGNWKETASLFGQTITTYSWYEKGKYICLSSTPITSLAQALQIEKAFLAEKRKEENENKAKLLREQAEQDKIAKERQIAEQAEKERLAKIIQDIEYRPDNIKFKTDSYQLTGNGMIELDKIIEWVKKKNNSEYKVNSISLSTHTVQGNYDELGEKMMFVLCLNRALVVKKYLASKLNGVQINSYACLDKVAPGKGDFNTQIYGMDEKRVEIVFNKSIPIAARVHNELSGKYGIAASDKIIPNQYMKQNIIAAINSYYADGNIREEMNMCSVGGQTPPEHLQKIPKEFWVQMNDNNLYEGEEPAYVFKNTVTTLMKKLDKKYDTKVQPNVLFHLEDKNEMKFEL